MNKQDRIAIDPEILVGKPVVKGTRLAMEFIIDLLAQGWTEKDILRNYPSLSQYDPREAGWWAGGGFGFVYSS